MHDNFLNYFGFPVLEILIFSSFIKFNVYHPFIGYIKYITLRNLDILINQKITVH